MPRTLASSLPVPTDPPPAKGVLSYLGVDTCVRLPLRVDAGQLSAELNRLPAEAWAGANRGRVVLGSVDSFLVVGYPRGPQPLPPDDREVLADLPTLKHVIRERIPAPAIRGIVTRLPPDALIPIHTDTLALFRGLVRLSIQVAADGPQRFFCGGLWYDFAPGEVWLIHNLVPHGINNAGGSARTSVIVDYLPSDDLVRLIADGDHGLGSPDEPARLTLESKTKERYRAQRWERIRYGLVKLWRRRGRLLSGADRLH